MTKIYIICIGLILKKGGWIEIKKEILKEYNIVVKKIYKKDEFIYFFVGNKKIYIEEVSQDKLKLLNDIVMASNEMYEKQKNSRIILKCLNNEYYFKYKDKNYILSFGDFAENTDLSIDDIKLLKIEKSEYERLRIDTIEKWEKSIDEIETAIVEYNKEYKQLMKYINYYIGISENAIQLCISKSEVMKNMDWYLGHYTNNYIEYKYSSPLNIKKINIGHVLGKYIKQTLYKGIFSFKLINKLKPILKNESDKYMLLATLMFQEEFFEDARKIIASNQEVSESKLVQKYINKEKDLESILRYVEDEIICEQIINWLED